jgi:hypothetical protein
MNITKLIPFYFQVKSLYWVRKEKEMQSDLSRLFTALDFEEPPKAREIFEQLKTKWNWDQTLPNCPKWFSLAYSSEFLKAETLLEMYETLLNE